MTETTPVVIVGAGPSGLVLALSLAQFQVRSIVLEKETEPTQDPRGVHLSGDSIRVFWSLGIREELSKIGHEQTGIQFHKGSLTNLPFMTIDTQSDWRHQTVPDGIMQIQPQLERILCTKIESSEYCQLRRGAEVVAVKEVENGMAVEYRDNNGIVQQLNGSWLIGADGKRGFVRKHYLEPVAGVKQEQGLYPYEATWVAANLHIKLPTPETHPDFPVWSTGMTPEEVYDLFWPKQVHFVSPPGKPTASMRFGPVEARLWRHEFAEPDWTELKDATALLWEHLLPMVTRDHDNNGRRFPKSTFPQDCIEIRRCAPYAFTQKVVNKWFEHRTILIGDAAHVFPPFGGQGLTAGIRDAHALAWRLAVLTSFPNVTRSTSDEMLNAWSRERKHGVDESARFTKANGELANREELWTQALIRKLVMAIESIPWLPRISRDMERAEAAGYSSVKDGCFLTKQRGGGKIAQVYVRQNGKEPILSDELLQHGESSLTIFLTEDDACGDVERLIEKHGLPVSLISKKSIVSIQFEDTDRATSFRPCLMTELASMKLKQGYDPGVYQQRLGYGTKYAILRPDFIIYATAKNLTELDQSLEALKKSLKL